MKTSNYAVAATLCLFSLLARSSGAPNEITFAESFALADDRSRVLEQLVPGTDQYYYYHALHLQHQGKLADVDKLVGTWNKRHGRTQRLREIEFRQAFLAYDGDHKRTLEFIRKNAGLNFGHQQQLPDQRPNLPSALDQKHVSRGAFEGRARSGVNDLRNFEHSALDWMLRDERPLDAIERRDLLRRLKHPDYPKLIELIVADFKTKQSRGFGEMAIHSLLLREQLDELAQNHEKVRVDNEWVRAYLVSLYPSEDLQWHDDPAERRAYLERALKFTRTLDPAFNSLKANILYHLLKHHRDSEDYPKDLFMEFIKLPRAVNYFNPKYVEGFAKRQHLVDLNANYKEATSFPPIINDHQLIREYLLQFFVKENEWEGYARYLRDTFVKPIFAEAKIVNAIGDAEQWASLLSPSAYQALKDRVDLDFAPANPRKFSPGDKVTLGVDIKNVKSLLVKIYEINALSYYLDNGKEINTDLNLDGLAANSQKSYDYSEAPARRVRRTFDFPELTNRKGSFVIEFIGNGRSSRALVRKGELQFLSRNTSAGTVFAVLDGDNKPAKAPAVWLGGRRYTPDKNGNILVPYSTNPSRTPVVLTDGTFASLDFFQHPAENYAFTAGIHVEREALLPNKTVQVVIRPSLSVAGRPASLELLEDVNLVITSSDQDGISTTSSSTKLEFDDKSEFVHEFRVPDRATSLTFSVQGKVKSLSTGKEQNVAASRSFGINAINGSAYVSALHLMPTLKGWVLELRGKTGEPRAEQSVTLTFKHRDFKRTWSDSLKTNSGGRIDLGEIADITNLTATPTGGQTQRWVLPRDFAALPDVLHGAEGEVLMLPYMGKSKKATPAEFALFEVRAGAFVADHFDKISLRQGYLTISGLEPGDYRLVLRPSGKEIRISVTAGEERRGYVLGKRRHLEVSNPTPLHITTAAADKKKVTFGVVNASEDYTRVHVIATRYLPHDSILNSLDYPAPGAERITRGQNQSRYLSGRDIGEEYRYILERRNGIIFPGNMLERPWLLLNPWELRSTQTETKVAKDGEEWQQSAEREGKRDDAKLSEMQMKQAGQGMAAPQDAAFATFDFFRDQAPVFLNLKPDKDGKITIDREKLGDRHYLHVIAIDPDNTVYRQFPVEEELPKFNDLRLRDGLDPGGHFAQARQAKFVTAGDVVKIDDLRSTKLEIYDNLGDVFQFLQRTQGGMVEWSFLLNWPKLEDAKKEELYSKYASHELNFFIAEHDPAFFAKIAPYLANKKDKTFVDHYLTGADLISYTESWSYGRLNTFEQALLGRRLGGGVTGRVGRRVGDAFNMIPIDVAAADYRFDTALRGLGLASGRGGSGMLAVTAGQGIMGELTEGLVVLDDAFAAPSGEAAPKAARLGEVERTKLTLAAAREAPAEEDGATLLGTKLDADAPRKPSAKSKSTFSRARRAGGVAGRGFLGDESAKNVDFAITEKKLRDLSANLQLYRKLEATKEWAENNYYHLPIEQQTAGLISVNGFWNDYAQWSGEGPFLSSNFTEATRSLAEALLALGALDLPFESEEHDIEVEDNTATIKAAGPAIIFYRETRPADISDDRSPILVSQNFYRHGDRYRHEGNEKFDKFLTEEFISGVVYGCEVIVTNPSSTTKTLEVLTQIPRGALPSASGKYTNNRPMRLEPYATQKFDYFFYFPLAPTDGSDFPHFPVHVAKDEQIVAWAEPFSFNVVPRPTKKDLQSWDYISQMGSEEDVLKFLDQNNLLRVDLERIAWRMRERPFFDKVTALLQKRFTWNRTLFSYSVHHDALPVMREFLRHEDRLLAGAGTYLDSTPVRIEPVERHWYQHLEYAPLVNARAHQLGRKRTILNDRFFQQYHQLMDVLSRKKALDHEDRMDVVYFLFLQDRVAEAISHFERVESSRLPTRLQHDYFSCYVAFYQARPEDAHKIAANYREHPVERWRKRFENVIAQANEIAGKESDTVDPDDREQKQAKLAKAEPSFDFEIKDGKVELSYQNLKEVAVNYYLMDLELLFSNSPFLSSDSQQFSIVKPNLARKLQLPAGKRIHQFALPDEFLTENVMVEIIGAGQKKAQTFFANDLDVTLVENFGRVEVRHRDSGNPLPKVYVKVYGRFQDGNVRFFKDGYTDLRGKFDYTSLNTNELDHVSQFAILVLSNDDGALVREAKPPKR